MPGTSKATNPRGYTIEFDEATHTYHTKLTRNMTSTGAVVRGGAEPFDGFGKIAPDGTPDDFFGKVFYVSGTKVIHHFFQPFDPDGKIAANKAKKMGISVEQLRFQWKQKAANACALGTRVHETCEDVLRGRRDLLGKWEFRNKPQTIHEQKLMAAGFSAAQKVMQTMDVIGIEQIVFDIDCQIAGTIDLLCRAKSDPNLYWILDWKTNEKIDFNNRFGVHGLYPIEHLEDCSGTHYALQLSLYEFLLRIGKYIPHGAKVRRGIFHLTDEGAKFYELPDFAIEVRNMVIAMLEQPPF